MSANIDDFDRIIELEGLVLSLEQDLEESDEKRFEAAEALREAADRIEELEEDLERLQKANDYLIDKLDDIERLAKAAQYGH